MLFGMIRLDEIAVSSLCFLELDDSGAIQLYEKLSRSRAGISLLILENKFSVRALPSSISNSPASVLFVGVEPTNKCFANPFGVCTNLILRWLR